MNRKLMAALAAGTVVAIGGTGAALALGRGGGDESLSGLAADRAVAAALEATGGGTANSVERDDEHGATYEVEVTKPDGSTVDVRLDAAYGVVVVDSDSEVNDGRDTGEAE